MVVFHMVLMSPFFLQLGLIREEKLDDGTWWHERQGGSGDVAGGKSTKGGREGHFDILLKEGKILLITFNFCGKGNF